MTIGVSMISDRTMQAAHYTGAGTVYMVEVANGDLYCIYVNSSSEAVFVKSTDGGVTWSSETIIHTTGLVTALAVWYDRWSNISAGLIHCAYTESSTDDTHYRSIDTESSDSLSTETTIFAGASTAANGCLSITRSRGGNLFCATMIDAGAEGGFFRSTDVGANWSSVATVFEAHTDQIILVPGFAADDEDIIAIYWDQSATEISRKLYDDSGDSWSESSIATSMTMPFAAGGAFANFSAAVDLTNSQIVFVAWSALDTSGAKLRAWTITESAITEVTNVEDNSLDDQGLCAVGIDTATGDWYVFYTGHEFGSDTWNSATSTYYRVSDDGGSTWGDQTVMTPFKMSINSIWTAPRFDTDFMLAVMGNVSLALAFNVPAAAGGGRAMLVNEATLVG